MACQEDTNSPDKLDQIDKLLDSIYSDKLEEHQKANLVRRAQKDIYNLKDDSLKTLKIIRLANRYYYLNDLKSYYKTSHKLTKHAVKLNDSANIAYGKLYLGEYFYYTNKSDSSYYYYNAAEKIYKNLNEPLNYGTVLLKKAYLLSDLQDFINSEKLVINAIKKAKTSSDKGFLYECYNFLGILLFEANQFEKSKEYHLKALETIDDLSEDYEIYKTGFYAQSYNNLGKVSIKLNKYFDSKHYYEKGLSQDNLKTDFSSTFYALEDNLNHVNYILGNTDAYAKSLKTSIALNDSLNNPDGVLQSQIRLAEFYKKQNDEQLLKKYSQRAYELALEVEDIEYQLKALRLLGQSNTSNNSQYYERFIEISDSIVNNQRRQRGKFARIEYETDQIQMQKEIVEAENVQIQYEKWLIVGSSLLGLLILILWFSFEFQKAKNKRLKAESEQQKTREEIYELILKQQSTIKQEKLKEQKRISEELHDGIMGKLSAIRLNLFVLEKNKDEKIIQKCIKHIRKIKDVELEIRQISHDLNKPKYYQNGDFNLVIKELLDDIKNPNNELKYQINIDEEIHWDEINSNTKAELYRILQESFQNIRKYSKAEQVIVDIKKYNNSIKIIIEDNGVGFDISKKYNGIGIKNMKSRAKKINANFDILSDFNKGTRIELNISL